MPQSQPETRAQIKRTIDYLIARKTEITVKIGEYATPFASRITKVNYGDESSETGKGPELIMERLAPEEGNAHIESGSHLKAIFSLRDLPCRFNTRCLNTPREEPDEGLIVSFPESIDIRERRRRDRRSEKMPDFVNAVVRLKDDSGKEKTFKLEVFDCTVLGVGILVRNEYIEVLERIEVGEKLRDITLYGSFAIVEVKGTVRHKSKHHVDGAEFHVIGVEFEEVLKDFSAV